MTPETTDPEGRTQAQWLRKLDQATKAHEKTRSALDQLIADARKAGVSLTAISDHSPYSREWVRRIAGRLGADRPPNADSDDQQSADSPQHP